MTNTLILLINDFLFNKPDTIEGLNKIILNVLIISTLLLYSIIIIVFYFGCLFIIRNTELENKYPKLKPIIKYYLNTSYFF